MGQINFARVDARLIHGQVTTGWSNSVGINAIYIIDNPTANDDFMKMIYQNLERNYSFKIKIFTLEEAVDYWNTTEFENDKVMLLFKDVEHAHKAREMGIPFEVLNVGGAPKTGDNEFVADQVALTSEQVDLLRELSSEYDVDIFFQVMPSAGKKQLSEVK